MAFDIFCWFCPLFLFFVCFSFFLISQDFSGGEYKCYIWRYRQSVESSTRFSPAIFVRFRFANLFSRFSFLKFVRFGFFNVFLALTSFSVPFDIQVLRPMHPLNLVSVCGYTFTSPIRCGRKYQSRTEGGMGLDKGSVKAGSGKRQMGIRWERSNKSVSKNPDGEWD